MSQNNIVNLEVSVILGIDVPHYFERFQRGWSNESELRGNIGYVFRHYVPPTLLEKMGLSTEEAVDRIWESLVNGRLLRLRNAVYEELDHYYETLASGTGSAYLSTYRRAAKSIAILLGQDGLDERCRQVQEKLEQHFKSKGENVPPSDFAENIAACLKTAVARVEEIGDGGQYKAVEEDVFGEAWEEEICL